jgi:hypothetical protein
MTAPIPESTIQANILLGCGAHPDVRLFRNTVGEGWQGEVVARDAGMVRLHPGDVVIRGARAVTFGLAPGSADLIGVRRVSITPRMFGQTIGRLVAIEVKTQTGRLRAGQENFLNKMQEFGAVAGVARSVQDAHRMLGL